MTDVLDGINALAKTRRTRVAVVIDELQQLIAERGLAAERQLRSVVQTHAHLSYVFAGSMNVAEDVPYNVQRLASRCWDLLGAAPAPVVDARWRLALAAIASESTRRMALSCFA